MDTETDQAVDQAKALVTAYLNGDRATIDQLIDESGDPVLVAALSALTAYMVKRVAQEVDEDPEILWSRTMVVCAAQGI